ncbi:binary cytotoxin component [Pseudomonas floridensis]|uniref:Binary cytotoxin component n=1 Tax=Pseudomonas floridensis TaxID=1958950 RepID=A0A1X0NCY0_9PSED|nr:alpha-xenorhabdolysin family binary toxin subunit A [Pseudomonas floridensis]ORC61641.1 binary cytotoxin component [Pseudomonas floridensis]
MQNPLTSFDTVDIERVATKPVAFFNVMLEDEKNDGRAQGVVLTKEDIHSIKRYERHGLDLPITLITIQQDLRFRSSGIPGLEPKDILATYLKIHQHARSWSGIERNIKETGFNTDAFAKSFFQQGSAVLEVINGMNIIERINMKIADLDIEQVWAMKPAELSADEQQICTSLAGYLSNIAESIDKHRHAAEVLANDLQTFTQTLTVSLIPDVAHKVKLAGNSDLDELIKELQEDIERLTVEIEQKIKEYKKTAASSAWGLFGGPLGLAITGGIFGSKAEKIRKEKNRLIHQKNTKVQLLKEKSPLAAAVRNLETLFEDMQFRMLDAHQSATNLQDLWGLMRSFIEQSATAMALIKSDQELLIFALNFRGVVNPWEHIHGITAPLLKLFNDALDQYRLEQTK